MSSLCLHQIVLKRLESIHPVCLVNTYYRPGTVLGTVVKGQQRLSFQVTDHLVSDREKGKQSRIGLTGKLQSTLDDMCAAVVSNTCSGGRVPGLGSESAASPKCFLGFRFFTGVWSGRKEFICAKLRTVPGTF